MGCFMVIKFFQFRIPTYPVQHTKEVKLKVETLVGHGWSYTYNTYTKTNSQTQNKSIQLKKFIKINKNMEKFLFGN